MFTDYRLVRQAHAVGAEDTRQWVHKHTRHAQRIGHQAGMLAARATKTLQRVARHVVAACHADLLDGVGHLLHSDLDEAFGHFFGLALGLRSNFFKAGTHRIGVQCFVGGGAKHAGEVTRLHLAHHHVGIGHGQRAAPAVAHRAWVGACALGAHSEAGTVVGQHRAAASRHRVDAHHGGAHAHTSDVGFELALERTGVVTHISGRSAHVKADDLFMPGQARRARHAYDATCGPRQNRILALEGTRIGEAPRRLHEEQLDARHLAGDLLHIAAQDG
ncbi:hypothetical protein D3C71_1353050 [compost metagenome]